MTTSTRWILLDCDPEAERRLSETSGVSALVARLLIQRGVGDVEALRQFVRPSLAELADPFTMADMDLAVARLVQAIEGDERVVVHGDYDADGVTSTALLVSFLRQLGLSQVGWYTPSRITEGYGLHVAAVDHIADQGCDLLVTVDHGVTAVEPVAHANARGLDVVVVDHHLPGQQLPNAVAVLDPHRSDCAFPQKTLAAVGVTFYLLMALRKTLRERGWFNPERPEPNLRQLLDLVALGTVADVVPLQGDNRILVAHGLREISAGARTGIAALKRAAGIGAGPVRAGQLAFGLGPRINAAGRIASADAGVSLLLSNEMAQAWQLASSLEDENRRRQTIEARIVEDALAMVEQLPQADTAHAIVLAHDDWHPGVVGIVASRIVERFHRPTIIIALDGEVGRGSGRSVSGFDLHAGLCRCAAHLQNFGGHPMAAGVTIVRDKLPAFRQALAQAVAHDWPADQRAPKLTLDAEISAAELDLRVLEQLELLAPFGMGNREPQLLLRQVKVLDRREVGKGHLKLDLVADGRRISAIGFRMAHRMAEAHGVIDVACRLQVDDWNGVPKVQLRLTDLRAAE